MKANAITRIVIYSIILILLLGLLCAGLNLGMLSFHLGVRSGNYITGEGSVPASQISELEIDWAAGSITIQVADTDQIQFTETGASENNQMAYELSGNRLRIVYSDEFQIRFGSTPGKDLIITVPADWFCTELQIDAAAVDLEITGLMVRNLDIDGAANTVLFRGGTLDTLDCDGASNSITAEFFILPSELNLDGASVSLDITLPSDTPGYHVEMDGVGLSYRSDFTASGQNGSYVYGNGQCEIEMDGLSCSIIIRKGS